MLQLRQQYYNRKIKQLRSSDPRKWWQSVKRFIGFDQIERSEVSNLATQLNYDEDCALAIDINKFFAGVASDIKPLRDDFCDQFVCDCDSCAKYTIEPWQVEIKLSRIQLRRRSRQHTKLALAGNVTVYC